ncbi:MAG: serine--tRNA ligase [Candidatus Contubernalis sp.]|nr:serine--tRNA ligase [Candidatus Contubernalis sp.]
MLDMKFIRQNTQQVRQAVANKGETADLEGLLQRDDERREILFEVEQLKNRRNVVSQEVGHKKKSGEDTQELIEEMKTVNQKIKAMDDRLKELSEEINFILLNIPNIPDDSVPVGAVEEDNVTARTWGEPPRFNFPDKAHWDLGMDAGILDFERAGKITGSRFALYYGLGAQLERALLNFMLDLHTREHGYTEVFPPFMVHRDSMIGTGQLPKFEEDAFKVENSEYYLIPTAEVPVTNLFRDEILTFEELPKYFVAYSACFRAEAGAHGRDTRGLIRQHQFNKVELVKFVTPENSEEELEKLVRDAEKVLQLLQLPYRVVDMCTGDLGFAAAKKYDIEVWMPAYDTYREISSCSNFRDFQARRANIRFRPGPKAKTQYVHTLNGSGVAVGRTTAAILENYQEEDGSIRIPEVLLPYFPRLEGGKIYPLKRSKK